MKDQVRRAYLDPFLVMPDDYTRCPRCGVYCQIDADGNVMACQCGRSEYSLLEEEVKDV